MKDPEKHKAFARAIVAVMREHDAHGIDITYRLRDDGPSDPFEQGRITWQRGRHDSEGTLNIVTTSTLSHIDEVRPFGEPITKGNQP